MMPRWKLIRETKRIQGQFQLIPWYFTGKYRKRMHDRDKHRTLKVTDGGQEAGENLAILLIFQPNGLLESTFQQVRYLASKGFSTLIVTNAPIRNDDMKKLAPDVFQVMERPNYGYDFGGYRDGVLHCLDAGLNLKNLIVMNDSVWFPVSLESNLIQQAFEHPANLFGVSYYKHRNKPHLNHVQSYFFRFNQKVISDPFFESYWREMPVSSNRFTVIRKCEMRLTNAFQSRGFSVGYLFDDKAILEHIQSLPEPELKLVLEYLVRSDPYHTKLFKNVVELMEAGRDWLPSMMKILRFEKLNLTFVTLPPHILVSNLKSPVLKKDRKGIYCDQRRELNQLDLGGQITSPVAKEIESWDAL